MVKVTKRKSPLRTRAGMGREGATHRFIELHLLLQVEADDAVVIVDPVTVEVIHLSYKEIIPGISSQQDFKRQQAISLLG